MKKTILVLRIIETLLLVVLHFDIHIMQTGSRLGWGLIGLNESFSLGTSSSSLFISTIYAGFFISLLGTVLMIPKVRVLVLFFPLLMAGLGILDLISNLWSGSGGQALPITVRLPLILCITDWLVWFKLKNSFKEDTISRPQLLCLSAATLIVIGLLPYFSFRYLMNRDEPEASTFVEAEVKSWIFEWNRDHFYSISDPQIIENSGGVEAFNQLWDTVGSITPFSGFSIKEVKTDSVYRPGAGLGKSCRFDITTRAVGQDVAIYFRVYIQKYGDAWKLYGFKISDSSRKE